MSLIHAHTGRGGPATGVRHAPGAVASARTRPVA